MADNNSTDYGVDSNNTVDDSKAVNNIPGNDTSVTVDPGNVPGNNSDTGDNADNPKHKGYKNLIPFTALTEEEQRQLAIKGGKASGEARKKKKHMREIAQKLLAHDMTEDQIEEVLGTAKSLLDGDMTVAAVLTARLIQEAADGNYKAYEVLRDTAGYKPKDQVEVDNISDADRALLERIAARVGLHNSAQIGQKAN